MSNRRKLKPSKKSKVYYEKQSPPEIIRLTGKSTAIRNQIEANIRGIPNPDVKYGAVISAHDSHISYSHINVDLTYTDEPIPRRDVRAKGPDADRN